jgi:hypothetical protein
MEEEIKRCYATMVTRIVRKPLSEASRDRLPVWICCPDRPVPKTIKDSYRDVTINDGLHYHGLAAIPPCNRLKEPLPLHVARYNRLYAPAGSFLRQLQVEPIDRRPEYVAGYAMKSLPRGRFDLDDILLLPRSNSEMRPRLSDRP